MTRKTKKVPEIVNLPTNNLDMEKFVIENRFKLYNSIVSHIAYGMQKRQSMIRVFNFDASPFVILINQRDFKENLEHIFDECIKREKFEMCATIKELLEQLNKPQYIKQYKKINIL